MITEKDINQFGKQCSEIFAQVSRDVIGQKEVVEGTIIAMIAGGNVLLEGVPGVGKTRLVRSLGRVVDLDVKLSFRSGITLDDLLEDLIVRAYGAARVGTLGIAVCRREHTLAVLVVGYAEVYGLTAKVHAIPAVAVTVAAAVVVCISAIVTSGKGSNTHHKREKQANNSRFFHNALLVCFVSAHARHTPARGDTQKV